jgi:hypothetical protein
MYVPISFIVFTRRRRFVEGDKKKLLKIEINVLKLKVKEKERNVSS